MNRSLFSIRNLVQLVRARRHYCSKQINEDEPIKFSTSRASQKNAIKPVLLPTKTSMPWYQPYIVTGSLTIFLIYFLVLREENDIDLEFDKTLYERIDGLEKQQLIQSYRYNKEHGLEVADIEKRLKEIEEQNVKKS